MKAKFQFIRLLICTILFISPALSRRMSPISQTTPDNNLSITIKIYFDEKLADNQTFSYDQVSDGTYHMPKDFEYKISVK